MRFFERRLVAVFLLSVTAIVLAGCAATRPQSGARPKKLEDIKTSVPRLTGLPLRKAQKVLAFVALKVGEVTLEETDDTSLHGQVFEQDPAPGTPVRGGTSVNLKVYRFGHPAEESSSEK